MDIQAYKKEVSLIDWRQYSGSIYYKPDRVPDALLSLALAEEESKEGLAFIAGGPEPDMLLNPKIQTDLLFAIGNDHRGTYYPVVQAALPFIIEVSLFGNHEVARNCAINTLIDLYIFSPEAEGFSVEFKYALQDLVEKTIKKTIVENKQNYTQFSNDYIRNTSLISSLIGIIEDDDE